VRSGWEAGARSDGDPDDRVCARAGSRTALASGAAGARKTTGDRNGVAVTGIAGACRAAGATCDRSVDAGAGAGAASAGGASRAVAAHAGEETGDGTGDETAAGAAEGAGEAGAVATDGAAHTARGSEAWRDVAASGDLGPSGAFSSSSGPCRSGPPEAGCATVVGSASEPEYRAAACRRAGQPFAPPWPCSVGAGCVVASSRPAAAGMPDASGAVGAGRIADSTDERGAENMADSSCAPDPGWIAASSGVRVA
jgi:hypothetical protein